jgi:hypothetical protein
MERNEAMDPMPKLPKLKARPAGVSGRGAHSGAMTDVAHGQIIACIRLQPLFTSARPIFGSQTCHSPVLRRRICLRLSRSTQ